MKNILITAPADPLLSRLTTRFLSGAEHVIYRLAEREGNTASEGRGAFDNPRLVRVDGLEIDSAGEPNIDEVWHAAGAQDSSEHLQTTRALLSFIERAHVPVINYVGGAFAQAKGGRAIESEILAASSRCGLAYRVFKPSIMLDLDGSPEINRANAFYRLLFQLMEFKEEIADRAPEYFKANAMSLTVRPDAKLDLIDMDHAAEAAFEIASRTDTLNGCYHLGGADPASFSDYCEAISDALGIKLNLVDGPEHLNPIDELFHLRAGDLIDFLNDGSECGPGKAACIQASGAGGRAASPGRQLVIQTALGCYDAKKSERSARVEVAIASLERARLELPDDQVLNYYAGGSGPDTILIINAYGQSINYWKRLIARLIESHRVIVWVARGNEHETIGINRAYPVAVHVSDLERLLAREGAGKCNFIGWCTGAKMILEYYSRNAEKVSTMTFLGPTFKNGDRLKGFETSYERTLEPLLAMVRGNPGLAELLMSSLKAVLLTQASSAAAAGRPLSRKQALEMLTSVNASLQQFVLEPFSSPRAIINFAGQLDDFWRHDVMPLLPQVKAPALFVSGECDKIASTEMAEAASKMMPAAKLLSVKGGSHYLQYEKDEMLAEIINKFLAEGRDFEFNHRLVTVGR